MTHHSWAQTASASAPDTSTQSSPAATSPAAQVTSNQNTPTTDASAPVAPKSPPLASNPSSGSSSATRIAVSTYPKWSDLSGSERTALKPLASLWPQMTLAHKNKWLALSANFAELSPSDQEKLQNRMTQWGSLTSEQRTQARFIFNQVQQIPTDDRLSKWQAYQALNAEKRDLLAQDALVLPHSAAIAPKPISTQTISKNMFNDPKSVGTARIDLDQIASKTLLPPRVMSPAP
jgi:Protein of unknown function (DUF3106)